MTNLRRINTLFLSNQLWTPVIKTAYFSIVLKFLLFDLLWCLQTTFTSFSKPELYIHTLTVSLLLLLPVLLTGKRWANAMLLVWLDMLFICNLMYNRTYNSLIPLDSYVRAGNLYDFSASVVDQMRWYDMVLPLETLLYLLYARKKRHIATLGTWKHYVGTVVGALLLSGGIIMARGGICQAINRLQTPNEYTCAGPIYTIFGYLLYDALCENQPYTPEDQALVETWLRGRPAYRPLPSTTAKRDNLIVIYCESLESWVIDKKIEGKEITPCLNKIVKEASTLYAPYVLTQVRGGRSIDAQLMISAGLLPIKSGCYAFKYPDNTYPTLIKAMKARQHTESYLLTVDKPIIWNQGTVARQFGFDHIYSKSHWKQDGATGPRKNLPDAAFFQQAIEKMQSGEIWEEGEHAFVQMVTYSGHSPFRLPDELKKLHLKGDYPDKMADYIVTANYTDAALGHFVNYVKSRSDYSSTMIVIVGDHEGLAGDRADICASPKARHIVSDKQFTPFIIINAPVGLKYNQVMGQIDQYPTLLNLMRLDDYPWKGLGQSILDNSKLPVAVGSDLHVEKSMKGRLANETVRLKKAYEVSDIIIAHDVLKKLQ